MIMRRRVVLFIIFLVVILDAIMIGVYAFFVSKILASIFNEGKDVHVFWKCVVLCDIILGTIVLWGILEVGSRILGNAMWYLRVYKKIA